MLICAAAPLLLALLNGCAAAERALGREGPCEKAERLSEELEVPLDKGATTVGDLENNLVGYQAKAEEALAAGVECLRQQPLPK